MEAATLNSPPCRNIIVSPIQKSLSLPSYAKAGGEGIDHRIIFAALEQKERVRRKSRIFTKEKKQNNLFCLPIKSNNKCRETSLSSDTSCSSLEYQKPSKGKKEEVKCGAKDGKAQNGLTKHASNADKSLEVDPKYDIASDYTQDRSSKLHLNGNDANPNTIKVTVNVESTKSIYQQQFLSNASDDKNRGLLRVAKGLQEGIYRSGIGSSGDSMERSSRSSSDSLSRKERMVALKARVEAQREKYGAGSSSEDELPRTGQRITRYNSDDVIHRTVREVKSKSSRMEKRLRRRSQDEWALKRAARKQNISLYISPGEDIFGSYREKEEPESKTDFCPSPQFPDLLKKNYFSDFPTRENVTRFVQARIKCIENEEMMRRNSIDKLSKPVRHISSEKDNRKLQNSESSPSHNTWDNLDSDIGKPSLTKTINPPSPTPKSPKAPTPPPRSPKSLTFVNKAFLQHQNTSHAKPENRSLERKPLFEPNIRSVNKSVSPMAEDSTALNDAMEKRKIRELISSRRKTCSNFSFLRDMSFDSSITPTNCHESNTQSVLDHESSLHKFHNGKSFETKGYTVNSENVTCAESKVNMLKNKWNEMEQRREMQFNSLESNVNALSAFLNKRKDEPAKHTTCLCSGISEGKRNCLCIPKGNEYFFGYDNQLKMPEYKHYRPAINLTVKSYPSSRLSKSEANIAAIIQPKILPYNSRVEAVVSPTRYTGKNCSRGTEVCNEKQNKQSATANLESAMEELESVYQSLKYSSDNLSDKNSIPNASEEESHQNTKSFEIKLRHPEISQNSNTDVSTGKDSVLYSNKNKSSNEFQSSALSSASNIASSPKSSISESLCIDELFSDLTRQLDFEQKLLKESRDPKILPQSTSNLRSVLDDKVYQKHPSPLDSIVSIRKELYDNLYQSVEKSKDAAALKTNENDLAKKKYKAVRSLSANISNLMRTDGTNSGMKSPLRSEEDTRKIAPLHDSSHPDPPYVRSFASSPLAFERGRCEKGHDCSPFSFGSEAMPKNSPYQSQSPKEIRQIRVSMDNSPSKPKPVQISPNQSFSRLTSAVCQPQTKSHLPKFSESDMPRDIPKKTSTIDALDEAALEDLLKSLLSEVPHQQEVSTFPLVETVASQPVTLPAGEMLVMQHLDVLRLKPMLS